MDKLTIATPLPTPERPLLGATVLVVEDSRFASEALRMLCLRSGARIRRADCINSAERHLQTYRPTVAIVDIGLPDGSGLNLIRTLSTDNLRPFVLLGTSGQDRDEIEQDVLDAGADAFLAKPIESLATFQNTILQFLPPHARPRGPRKLNTGPIDPDLFAFQEDLSHATSLLEDPKVPLEFIGEFLKGIARTGADSDLMKTAESLEHTQEEERLRGKVRALLQSRLKKRIAI